MANNYEVALQNLQINSYENTVAGHLSRIEDSKVVIVNKLTDWGKLADESGWTIDDAALTLNDVQTFDLGEVELTNAEKEFGPGYYKGFKIKAGEISGVYKLQEKEVTPSKEEQEIVADLDHDALSKVIVHAIPAAYQDVTSVTATADKVLTGSVYVDSTGAVLEGTMANNEDMAATLDTTTTSVSIPKGYHSGNGTVDISVESKTVDFNPTGQTITADAGKVLGSVTINAAPTTELAIDEAPVNNNDGTYKVSASTGTGYIVDANKSITLNRSELSREGSVVRASAGYNHDELTIDLIAEDADLAAENIKSGVEILGVTGTFTSADTVVGEGQVAATAAEILSGASAWVNGKQVNGSITRRDTVDVTLTPTAASRNIEKGYYDESGNVDVAVAKLTPDFNPAGDTIVASEAFWNEVVIPAVPETGILPSEVLTGKEYYEHGELKTGTMANHGHITVDADVEVLASGSAGVMLLEKTAGYVESVSIEFDGSLYARLASI